YRRVTSVLLSAGPGRCWASSLSRFSRMNQGRGQRPLTVTSFPASIGGIRMVKSVTTSPHRLRFGRYKGRTLDEVPPDYLATLRRFDGLYPATLRQIEDYLRVLVRDPGRARIPFGSHAGQTLDELETSYLDWLLGSDDLELGPALKWLVTAELRRRET